MKDISNMSELANEIANLRQQQQEDFLILQNQYYYTIDNLKPINLVKNALHDVLTAPDLKSNLIKSAIGFGTTYLSNKLYNENSKNPVKRIFSNVIKLVLNKFNKNNN